jgi:hypothetical protein
MREPPAFYRRPGFVDLIGHAPRMLIAISHRLRIASGFEAANWRPRSFLLHHQFGQQRRP